jgi:hypothetical protein
MPFEALAKEGRSMHYASCSAAISDAIVKQPQPSLRGANGSREGAPDDRLRDEAIHLAAQGKKAGLLRGASHRARILIRKPVMP